MSLPSSLSIGGGVSVSEFSSHRLIPPVVLTALTLPCGAEDKTMKIDSKDRFNLSYSISMNYSWNHLETVD